jgi:hypothetical protein
VDADEVDVSWSKKLLQYGGARDLMAGEIHTGYAKA